MSMPSANGRELTFGQAIREALAEGLEQADRGDLLDGDEAVREMRAFLSARRRSEAKS